MKKGVKIALWSVGGLVGLYVVLTVIAYLVVTPGRRAQQARLDGALEILREAAPYDNADAADFPAIRYADTTDPEIARVRDYFNVDSIAGAGGEVERMKNVMLWVHQNVKYDGSKSYDGERNSIALYEFDRATGTGINCRMVATLANELYLAAGFRSRFVTCQSVDPTDPDAHVINAVWSAERQKWLWMDSAFGVWVMDEAGEPMGVPEVREGLLTGRKMALNKSEGASSGIEVSSYLEKYMAKNLYWMGVEAEYRFNTETIRPRIEGIALTPPGFTIWEQQAQFYEYVTHNAEKFWQP